MLALALLDGALGAGALALALSHTAHRDALAHFAVYTAIVLFFKGREAVRRVPALVAQTRAASTVVRADGPSWTRAVRLLIGYDTWSRTERLGVFTISFVLCTLFGWDDGGPFAAALFAAIATVDACLALVAWGARLSRGELDRPR